MKRTFALAAAIPDLEILASNSPMTDELFKLVQLGDFFETIQGRVRPKLRQYSKASILAATDPWADIEYQSLYLTDMDPENRVILQEPSVKDPTVGVMVLKAARLRGESGMVYCGTVDQLKEFNGQLPGFEKKAEEMDEKDFLECLVDAASQMGLKVVYYRLSPEHGGDDDGE